MLGACLLSFSAFADRPFRVYPGFEGYDSDVPLPVDYDVPADFVVGRLMYPSFRGFFGRGSAFCQRAA